MRRFTVALALLLAACTDSGRACTGASAGIAPPGWRESARVPSPSGWCEAYVIEWEGANPQVLLSFDGGRCGLGAVHSKAPRPDFELRWLDATTLEVAHARDVPVGRNASGEVLQCGGPHRRVRVVLAPR